MEYLHGMIMQIISAITFTGILKQFASESLSNIQLNYKRQDGLTKL